MSDTGSRPGGLAALLQLPRQVASAAADAAEHVPVAGGVVRVARRTTHEVLDGVGTLATAAAGTSIGAVIHAVVDELSSMDLTPLIGAIDLNRVVDAVDLDAVLRDIDINALIARLDLDAMIGRVDIAAVIDAVDVAAIVDHLDIDAILDKIDIDAIVTRVDLDGAVERVDIDAIIARIDLIGLADEIIDGVDLPDIIREASTSVTTGDDRRAQQQRTRRRRGGRSREPVAPTQGGRPGRRRRACRRFPER